MLPTDGHRLFHAIVLMGVSLTGGAVASCGGSTATLSDAGPRDGAVDDAYAHISIDVADTGYSHIDAAVYDAIAFGLDHYPVISADSGVLDSSHDAPADTQGQDECYPCIAPVQWDI